MTDQRALCLGFWEWARREPSRTALIDADGTEHSYGALGAAVNAMSHGLREVAGLRTGDIVACVMANTQAMVALYLAAMQCGLYIVTLNYHLTADEIAHIVADSGSSAVVSSARAAGVVARATPPGVPLFVDGESEVGRPLSELTRDQQVTPPTDRTAGSIMQYTSGTTGRPKGVRRPLSGVSPETAASTYSWIFVDELQMTDAFAMWLVAAPMYHSSNITYAAGALHFGGTVVLMRGWSAENFLDVVQRYRVVGTQLVPTQFHRLLQLPEELRAAADLSSLRFVSHGAAPCPRETKQRMFDWLGPVIYEFYGSTEVGTTFARPHEWLARPGTVGRPASISTLKILDDDGVEVPAGVEGVVYMRQGEDRMEYHNDPGKTAAARRGGLLTVGDRGYVDADGFLFLTGRPSELVIVGGVNVYTPEIEAAILSHPWVGDAAVLGLPDDDLGEVPVAFLEPNADAPADDEFAQSIRAHCAGRLAKVKVPARFVVSERLPRDPNGKLYKARLRDMAGTASAGAGPTAAGGQ